MNISITLLVQSIQYNHKSWNNKIQVNRVYGCMQIRSNMKSSFPPLPPRTRQRYNLEEWIKTEPPPLPSKQSLITELSSLNIDDSESRSLIKIVTTDIPKITPHRLDVYRVPPFLYDESFSINCLSSQASYSVYSVISPRSKHLLIGTIGLRLLSFSHSNLAKQVPGLKNMITSRITCLVNLSAEYIWGGTSCGSIFIYHIPTDSIVSRCIGIHSNGLGVDNTNTSNRIRDEMIGIIFNSITRSVWTIDIHGRLFVWNCDRMNTFENSHTFAFKIVLNTSRSLSLSRILYDRIGFFHYKTLLFIVSKKYIIYCDPTRVEYSIQNGGPQSCLECNLIDITLLLSSLRIGSITCTDNHDSYLVTGHETGKIIIWDISALSPLKIIQLSMYKITSIKISLSINQSKSIWIGLSTGKIIVLRQFSDTWIVFAEWKSHRASISHFVSDQDGCIVSICQNNQILLWDETLNDIIQSKKRDLPTLSTTISLYLTTWNVAAIRPSTSKSFIMEWIKEAIKSDMFVIGLQEIVDLESKRDTAKALLSVKDKSSPNVMADESIQAKSWISLIQECLKIVSNKFILLGNGSMVGLFMAIWIRSDMQVLDPKLDWGTVKTGLGGIHGNKGSVYARCILNRTTSLALFNVHLAAGQESVSHRNADASLILRSASFPSSSGMNIRFEGGGDGSMALDCSYIFFFGDLNYRIQLCRKQVMQYIQQGDLETLWKYDQLEQQRHINPHFILSSDGFLEASIECPKETYRKEFDNKGLSSCSHFLPTYKYDIGKDDYDTGEKQRVPSWCDRILIRCQPSRREICNGIDNPLEGMNISIPIYRWECKSSDHRPVSAQFLIPVKNRLHE